MRTVRVYSEEAISAGTSMELGEDASRHISKVLRMRSGEALELFDGQGSNFAATISAVEKRYVTVEIGAAVAGNTESPLRTSLWLGVCRGGRMDYVVEKATELGVSHIQPVITERCVVKLKDERAQNRMKHWQKIAISAAEQSGRCRIPEIATPQKLSDCLASVSDENLIMLEPTATQSFVAMLGKAQAVTLLTGPEGGFSRAEIAAASDAGFQAASLGQRVMRSDTAPLIALGIAQALAGDLG